MSKFYPNVALVPWELIERAMHGAIDDAQFRKEVIRYARILADAGMPPTLTGSAPSAPTAPAGPTTIAADGIIPDDVAAFITAEIVKRYPDSALPTTQHLQDLWTISGRDLDTIIAAMTVTDDYHRKTGKPITRAVGFFMSQFRSRPAEDVRLEGEAIQRRRERRRETVTDTVRQRAEELSREVEAEIREQWAAMGVEA